MYNHAPRYLDRFEAIRKLSESNDKIATTTITKALNDKYSTIRRTAVTALDNAVKNNASEVKTKLIDLAKNDKNSIVRGDAITTLSKHFKDDKGIVSTVKNGTSEKSYYVISASLLSLSNLDSESAMQIAKTLEQEENARIKNAICGVYSKHGEAEQNDYFLKSITTATGFNKYSMVLAYNTYLKNQDNTIVNKGITELNKIATKESIWWLRLSGISALKDLEKIYNDKIKVAETELIDLKSETNNELDLRRNLTKDKEIKAQLDKVIKEIKATETHPRLKQVVGT